MKGSRSQYTLFIALLDDLHVAALEIGLLSTARPGVPEKRVSLSHVLLGISRATSRAYAPTSASDHCSTRPNPPCRVHVLFTAAELK